MSRADLDPLKSLEVYGIEIPAPLEMPKDVQGKFTYEEWKVFGAMCNKNPELMKEKDAIYLRNLAKCIKATANGKLDDVIKDPLNMIKHPLYLKYSAYYQNIKDQKAALRKDPSWKASNDARVALRKQKYGSCLLDGELAPLQSFTIEPEGIFEGRPGSPDQGLWKTVCDPSEIVVNTNSTKLPVFIVNEKEVPFTGSTIWEPTYHYAAVYPTYIGVPGQKPVSKKMAKIMFGAQSKVKKQGQSKKYEAGEALMGESAKLIKQLTDGLVKDPTPTKVAIYCLFFKGIRIGHKDPTRNGTKGLLSLEWGKDVWREQQTIKFDFIGKDSVRDVSELVCPSMEIAENIEKVWKSTCKLDTTKAKIENWVKARANIKFTPKLSRTMVAARTMLDALDAVTKKYNLTKNSPEALKKLAFNEANMAVAHQLNHQKGVSKAAKAKREEKFAETKGKLKEREAKADELTKKRKAKIKELKKAKKAGWEEKVAKLEEMIAKSEFRVDIAKKNANFKESEANYTASTSKAAYIDSKIIATWCDQIGLPIEKVYSKTQLTQFEDRINSKEEENA